MENNDILTEQQKEFIKSNYKTTSDLISLTRSAFNDDSLDGRTKEGRAVREYMVQEGLLYKTTKHERAKSVILTDEQKEFIVRYSSEGMSAFEIAKILFPEERIVPLSKQTIVVGEYIKNNQPENVCSSETALGVEYTPPRGICAAIKKINRYTGVELKEKELTTKSKRCVDSLILFIDSPRLLSVINGYTSMKDRELFEAEFIRATWDKPDLTNDEINLYINVCVDYINLKNISGHIEKLNRMFNDAEEQQDMTVRLAELLKTKSEEYNQCEKRMESLIQRLNGDRAKRIASKKEETTSILSIVNLFQDEKERDIMIRIAEMQKSLIREEAGNMENMPSWKARVLGVEKEDVI
jgi:phage gpG-like protein